MRKVIHHEHAAYLAANFLTALHAAERRKPLANLISAEPERTRRGVNANGILHVVTARHGQVEFSHTPTGLTNVEPHAIGVKARFFRPVVRVAGRGLRRHVSS